MGRAATVLAPLVLAGCLGNWSDEDLLFRLAVPQQEAVRLRLPGVELAAGFGQVRQGLNAACVGDDAGNITCMTRNAAHLFNSLTEALLGLVERVIAQDPTQRRAGARVWGPWSDGRLTYRFEMQRDDGVGDGGFRYCLHLARGRRDWPLVDRRVSCGGDTDAFYEVFSGRLVPGAHSAGDGFGDMVLLAGKLAGHGFTDDPKFTGRFEFRYDNRTGQDVDIALSEVADAASGLPARADYAYHRYDDASGFMRLALLTQLTCGGPVADCSGSPLETLALVARWNAAGASRVDALGSGGELAQDLAGWECADADQQFVARRYAWAPERDLGEASACPALDAGP